MAANDRREQVAWDLDWDDLTDGALMPTRRLPQATSPLPVETRPPASPPPATPATPPPLPRRAFPTPLAGLSGAESETIIEPQHLPTAAPTPASPLPSSPAATPLPRAPVRALVRGQRMKLAEIFPGATPPPFEAALTLSPAAGQTLDVCCFGLDENGKLSDDRYFIFFNQKSSPEGALSVRGANGEIFAVDLARLSASVRRLVFTATVDGAGSVRALGASRFELRASGGQAAARYEFSGHELDEVQALMVAEIYVKDGVWRVAAVGQGFKGGLGDVLRHFGGQEI